MVTKIKLTFWLVMKGFKFLFCMSYFKIISPNIFKNFASHIIKSSHHMISKNKFWRITVQNQRSNTRIAGQKGDNMHFHYFIYLILHSKIPTPRICRRWVQQGDRALVFYVVWIVVISTQATWFEVHRWCRK